MGWAKAGVALALCTALLCAWLAKEVATGDSVFDGLFKPDVDAPQEGQNASLYPIEALHKLQVFWLGSISLSLSFFILGSHNTHNTTFANNCHAICRFLSFPIAF